MAFFMSPFFKTMLAQQQQLQPVSVHNRAGCSVAFDGFCQYVSHFILNKISAAFKPIEDEHIDLWIDECRHFDDPSVCKVSNFNSVTLQALDILKALTSVPDSNDSQENKDSGEEKPSTASDTRPIDTWYDDLKTEFPDIKLWYEYLLLQRLYKIVEETGRHPDGETRRKLRNASDMPKLSTQLVRIVEEILSKKNSSLHVAQVLDATLFGHKQNRFGFEVNQICTERIIQVTNTWAVANCCTVLKDSFRPSLQGEYHRTANELLAPPPKDFKTVVEETARANQSGKEGGAVDLDHKDAPRERGSRSERRNDSRDFDEPPRDRYDARSGGRHGHSGRRDYNDSEHSFDGDAYTYSSEEESKDYKKSKRVRA